jgi:hypothetical protein
LTSRLRSVLVAGALTLVLVAIAAAAFGRGAEDWRYQLAGLANPFLGRPAPGLSVVVGIVISALIGAVVWRTRPSPRRAEGAVRWRWRWWWILIAGWSGYVSGGAIAIAGGGSIEYRGSMHLEFGAPFGLVADVPATCRSVVGEPELVAEVSPVVDGLYVISLRNVATGMPQRPELVGLYLTNDGVPGNEFEPPNAPDRVAPYVLMTRGDGSTEAQAPITLVQAYDYSIARFAESGMSGAVELTGSRFKDILDGSLGDGSSVRWVNLVITDDPWPETFGLTVNWTCDVSKP